ncbi:hypothetical protein BDV95DRAFT_484265 [Massariosphaeria phaeospora]|uniref:Uncharacterized protein n=1 Tax=Massariosphaeria phaeospora TaxID=100035 RepID=A0A7C8IBY1_9PLEO|nr:hypothetical protein BDV95DRAFT_484265 [Massariosphaeria phaeospora]
MPSIQLADDASQPFPSPPPQTLHRTSPERLGMTFDKRILLAAFTSFVCGFTLGSSTAGRLASLRFRAENAHRLPISRPGWYLYHKSKNYYKSRAGISEGMRKGVWLASWGSIFFIIEESMDVFRGTWRAGRTLEEMEGVDELDIKRISSGVEKSRDFVSSAMAGMVTGGLWSAWNLFPMVTAARTIRMGLLVGLGYGLGQDGLTYVRGRTVGYVDEAESWIYRGAKNRRKFEDDLVEHKDER